MTAVADLPPAVAVITLAPGESAETKPVAVMVAMFGDDEIQLTVAPETVRPCASTGFAVICTNPLARSVTFEGVTEMLATVCTAEVMVTSEYPTFPSTVHETRVVPALTASTVPEADTVATEGVLEDQVVARPVRTLPPASVTTDRRVLVRRRDRPRRPLPPRRRRRRRRAEERRRRQADRGGRRVGRRAVGARVHRRR